jgi:hypothetical protein
MSPTDPLQCTFEDARRVNLRQGVALSTSEKIAFFEEMVSFAARFGARDRLAPRRAVEPRAKPESRPE